MSKKTHSIWLRCPNYLAIVYLRRYQLVMLSFHDLFNVISECITHTLTQGIRTIKTFIKYKGATTGKFITKNTSK